MISINCFNIHVQFDIFADFLNKFPGQNIRFFRLYFLKIVNLHQNRRGLSHNI